MTPKLIKLYYSPGACSMAPQFLLEDSGLHYEAIEVNTRDPQSKAEYVKNVNPKGQLVPEKHYTGKTPLENVRFYEWINFLSGSIHSKAFTALFKPSAFSDDPAAEGGIESKARDNVLAGFARIEEKLAEMDGPKHALGDGLTGVDAYLVVFVRWAKLFQMDLSPFPNYTKLFESVTQMQAFKQISEQQI